MKDQRQKAPVGRYAMTFICDYVMGGMQFQEIMERDSSIDCVLSLAEDGATAIRVQPMVMP